MNKITDNINKDLFTASLAGCLCVSLVVSQTRAIHGQEVEAPDSFGFLFQSQTVPASGTVANATVSNVRYQEFMPVSGPIPQVEMALNYGGFIKELRGEIRNG